MIRVTCDGCEQPIDRDGQDWFGVDFTEVPDDEPDEDGMVTLREISVTSEHAHHFCSPDCLAGWAFAKTLETTQ